MIIKLTRYQLRSLINLKSILFIGLSAILNILIAALNNPDIIPTGNARATAFFYYYPINSNVDLYRLLLVTIPIIISVGSFVQYQITDRSLYILLHCKSYKNWFLSVIYSVWLFVIGMTIFQYLITYIGAIFVTKGNQLGEWLLTFPSLYNQQVHTLLLQQFSLFVLLMLGIVTFYLIGIYTFNQVSTPFLLTVIYLGISYLLVLSKPDLLIWFPLTYGLSGFREWGGYGYWRLFLLLAVLLVILGGVTYMVFSKRREKILAK